MHTTTFNLLEVLIPMLHIHTLLKEDNLDLANSTQPTLLPMLLPKAPSMEKLDFTNKPQLLDLSLYVLMLPLGNHTREEF